ncbi:MAG: ABC transporter ATP-binding protein [Thermoleophilia bacterium]
MYDELEEDNISEATTTDDHRPTRVRAIIADVLRIAAARRMFSMLPIGRGAIVRLIALAVAYAAFEAFGLTMLLPVLQYVEQGPDAVAAAGSSPLWLPIIRLTDLVGVRVNLAWLLVAAFLPILLRQLVFFVQSWYSAKVQAEAVARMRVDAFSAVMSADLDFFSRNTSGDILGLVTGQIAVAASAFAVFIRMIVVMILISLYTVMLFYISPIISIFTTFCFIAVSLLIRRNIRRSRILGEENTALLRELYSSIVERVRSMRLIKMLGQEQEEVAKIRRLSDKTVGIGVGISIQQASSVVIIEPLLMLAVFLVILVGVGAFHLSLASLGLFMFIVIRANEKVKEINGLRQGLSANMESLLFVRRMVQEARSSLRIIGGDRVFEGLGREIEIQHLDFAYSGSEPKPVNVLTDLSVTIPAGSFTALVGRSGAGKSTLVELICRLREPTSGRILFDGIPATEFELRSLRRSIGYLAQSTELLADTILANLTYGLDQNYSDADIERAIEQSFCSEFTGDLPQGLETKVGEQGVRLSGGQRQRLGLARVLLQNPDILVLDEPTSALDSESERYIQEALGRLHGHKTLIVIAHRLSTVQKADQILVLEQGRVVEQGTHEELLGGASSYKRLFELQINV